MPRVELSSPDIPRVWSQRSLNQNHLHHYSNNYNHNHNTPSTPDRDSYIEVNPRAENAIILTQSRRKSKNRIQVATNPSGTGMKSSVVKTTGSSRSTRRAQQQRYRNNRNSGVSHNIHNPNDNHFELQHEHMMSRQQFRTNTSSRQLVSNSSSNSNNSSSISNGNQRALHVIHGADSYESGYSHMSRRSDQLVPPRTIHQTDNHNRNETIQKVKIIISGENSL